MTDESLDAVSKAAAQDAEVRFRGKLAANARAIEIADTTRLTTRILIITLGPLGLLAFAGAVIWQFPILGSLACVCFMIVLPAGFVLFFMGGTAPGSTRRLLTKRERQRLDE